MNRAKVVVVMLLRLKADDFLPFVLRQSQANMLIERQLEDFHGAAILPFSPSDSSRLKRLSRMACPTTQYR
jgi:hypothetical protein